MSEDIRARLDEIKARAEAAAEGPWATDIATGDTGNIVVYGQAPDDDRPDERTLVDADVISTADAEFIAHARTDLPDMAAALTAVLNIPAELDDLVGDHGAQSFANGHNAALALVHHAITTVLGGDRG